MLTSSLQQICCSLLGVLESPCQTSLSDHSGQCSYVTRHRAPLTRAVRHQCVRVTVCIQVTALTPTQRQRPGEERPRPVATSPPWPRRTPPSPRSSSASPPPAPGSRPSGRTSSPSSSASRSDLTHSSQRSLKYLETKKYLIIQRETHYVTSQIFFGIKL